MNEKSLNIFIDLGSSKIRLGVFNEETSNILFILEKSCISNFSLKNFDIKSSNEIIKDLIKSAEKKIDMHIKNINLMMYLSSASPVKADNPTWKVPSVNTGIGKPSLIR